MTDLWPLLDGTKGDALFRDGHRLWLSRWWGDADAPYALHIGMNPSVAGAANDDLTVRKDQEFTKRLGLTRMIKCNVGTMIATDPRELLCRGAVVCHPDNLQTILKIAAEAQRIIIATGKPPDTLIPHARTVFRALRQAGHRMECFGMTATHWPKHSSRLAYATQLVEFVW